MKLQSKKLELITLFPEENAHNFSSKNTKTKSKWERVRKRGRERMIEILFSNTDRLIILTCECILPIV